MILELKVTYLDKFLSIEHIMLDGKVKLAPCSSSTCLYELNLSPNQNLDLTKRTMVHEGPLSWKMNKEKTIGL